MKVEQHIFQAPHEEVGLRALNNIYQRMQIDTEWSVRGERSFSWWAKDFVQHISVTEPVKSGAEFPIFLMESANAEGIL